MRVKVAVLALCMLFTGTINTIATKYQVNRPADLGSSKLGSFAAPCAEQQ
jgi:hypothetical protein